VKAKTFNFQKSTLCFLHFEVKYIIEENVITLNGNVIARENRKRWKLSPDAVPTLFSNDIVPSYFNKTTVKRKPPKERYVNVKKIKSCNLKTQPDIDILCEGDANDN